MNIFKLEVNDDFAIKIFNVIIAAHTALNIISVTSPLSLQSDNVRH